MRKLRAIAAALVAAVSLSACFGLPEDAGPLYDPLTEEHTEADPEDDVCVTEDTGEYLVNVDNTVVDGLCLTEGFINIQADNVTVQNSTIVGSPGSPNFFFMPILVDNGSDNALIRYNIIDCGGALPETPLDAASQGIRSPDGDTSGFAHNNEIKNCTDAIQLASDWTYSYNYITNPDNCDIVNVCDLHADGVQWDTEDDGSPIHDVLFEWNNIEFEDASSGFQWHGSTVETEGSYNIVVRYNRIEGGGWVMRLPNFGNGGNKLYGNHIGRLDLVTESGVCTPWALNGTDGIDVWGRETGSVEDWNEDGLVLDDDNVNLETGEVIERADCE